MPLNWRSARRVPTYASLRRRAAERPKYTSSPPVNLEPAERVSTLSSQDMDLRPDQRQRVYYSEQRATIGTRPARYGW